MVEPIKRDAMFHEDPIATLRLSAYLFENRHNSNVKLWWVYTRVQHLGYPKIERSNRWRAKFWTHRVITLWFGSKFSTQQWNGANIASVSCQILVVILKKTLLKGREASLHVGSNFDSKNKVDEGVIWTMPRILTHPYLVIFCCSLPYTTWICKTEIYVCP